MNNKIIIFKYYLIITTQILKHMGWLNITPHQKGKYIMKTNFNINLGNMNFTIDNTPINLENITLNYDGEMNAQEMTTCFGQLKDFIKMVKDAAEANRDHERKEIIRNTIAPPDPESKKAYGNRFKKMTSILSDLGFERTKRNYFDYTISESEDNPILIKACVSSFGWISVTLETRYTITNLFDITEEEGRVDYAYDIPEDIPQEDIEKINTILMRMKNIK